MFSMTSGDRLAMLREKLLTCDKQRCGVSSMQKPAATKAERARNTVVEGRATLSMSSAADFDLARSTCRPANRELREPLSRRTRCTHHFP